MNLEVLTSSESMNLCRSAAGLVQGQFVSMARRIEQGYRDLSRLFMELSGDMGRNLVEIQQLDAPGRLPESPEEEAAQKVALGFLPSLSKGGSEVRLDRESGFYRVECILEDLARFYGALVRQSCDEKSRDNLLRWKLTVEARLEFLHHVVLKERS